MRNQFDKTEPRYNGRPTKAMLNEFANNKIMKEFRKDIGHKNKYDNDQKPHKVEFIPDYAYQKYREDRKKKEQELAVA